MPAELGDTVGLSSLIRAVDREVERESLARDIRRKQAQSRKTRARRLMALSSCLLLAALAANLMLVGPFAARDRRLSAEAKGREIEKAIEFGVRRVEAHRRATGALPSDLATVGLAAADGWTYQAMGSADYRLGLSFGGERGVFDSSSGRFVFASGKGSK